MFNKIQKNQKKLNDKKESTKLEIEIMKRLSFQGGYTKEQQSKLVDLEEEFKTKLEELKIEILKKNLNLWEHQEPQKT